MSEPAVSPPVVLEPPNRAPRATNLLVAAYGGIAIADFVSVVLDRLGGGRGSTGWWTLTGLLVPALIWDGDWQRLFVSLVLHGEVLHLVVNSILLLIVGPPIERLFGRWRMLGAYLIAGLAGEIASAALLPGDAVVGASAGVFGLVGLLVGLTVFRRGVLPEVIESRMSSVLGLAVLVDLGFGLFGARINSVLHLGGLAAGFLLSAVLEPRLETHRRPARAALAGVVLVAGMGLLLERSRTAVVGTLWHAMVRAEEMHLRDVERAIAILEPALDDPRRGGSDDPVLLAQAQNALAWFYVEAGRNVEKGIRLSEDSLRAQPEEPAFLDTLGYLYALAGKCREAADKMGQAAELDSGYAKRRDEVNRACAAGRKPNPALPVEGSGAPASPAPARPAGTPGRGRGVRV